MDTLHDGRLPATRSTNGTSSCASIRVAIVDDNPLFRAGVVHVLKVQRAITVVAEGNSESDALRCSANADVLILDARIATSVPHLMRSIARRSSAKALLFATSLDVEQAFAGFAAGARGYILKQISGLELVEAVRAVHRGEGYVSPTVAATLLTNATLVQRAKPASASPLDQLTFREGEIFRLLAAGQKNGEIGQRLALTEKSVKRYVTSIFEKLQVRNRVEAAMLSRSGQTPSNGRTEPGTSLRARFVTTSPSDNPDSKSSVVDRIVTGP